MDFCAHSVGFRVDEKRRTIRLISFGPEQTWTEIGEPRRYPLRPDDFPKDLFRPSELWELAWVTLKTEQPTVYRALLSVVLRQRR